MYEDEDFGGQRDYKAERDTLIDDIKELRDLNEALKVSESVNWHSSREFEQERNELEKENKALRLQSDTYFDEWQTVKKPIQHPNRPHTYESRNQSWCKSLYRFG